MESNKYAPLPIEPIDKEWGVGISGLTEDPSPFPRVNRLLKWTKSRESTADGQRALIVTEGYKKYAMYPVNIKWALIMRDIFTNVKINIWPDELIVGEQAAEPNSAPIYPEFSFDWICHEFREGMMEKRTNDRYVISDEVKEEMLSIEDFWKNNTVGEAWEASLTEQEKALGHMGKAINRSGLFVYAGVGHVAADYETLFKKGFGGIRKEIEEKMAALDTADPANIEKQEFYQAELYVLEGASTFIRRYGDLAEKMAAEEKDEKRRSELVRIASNCHNVAEGAPKDFWEALQLMHLAYTMIIIESNGHSVTYGRFDKMFGPFYENDTKNGTLSREQIQELIECFYIKIQQYRKLRDQYAITFASGTFYSGTALDVGGVDENGNDITNDLSFMCLDAHAHTRIPNPWLGVRMHEGTPDDLKIKTFNVIRIGTGEPKIFNDAPIIKSLMNYGKPIEDARDYVGIGCVEPSIPGKTYGVHDSGSINMMLVLHLAINGGRCMDCGPACPRWAKCGALGKHLSIDTGNLATMKSFDEVLESYKKQMEYQCDSMLSTINKMDAAQQRLKPVPFLSLLIDGCIDKGKDASAGGAIYNHSGPQAVGVGTTADSLAVIKQLVFDEKRITGEELLQALRDNWQGHETLYSLVNSNHVHHYGNNDDYADELAKFSIETYCDIVAHKPAPRGGEFMPGVFSVTANVQHGGSTPASPDGRLAGEPLSDCMGPVHTKCCSHDVSGPTAIANSVTKIDHSKIANGIILNWKFSPSSVSGITGRDDMIDLMNVYMEKGGMQSQFSIVGRETMLAAQKKPQDFKDLLVRVAGYSAYFVELSSELQNDLIGRTELSFD